MRRTALALAVVLIAGFAATGPAGAGVKPAVLTITVDPSTGLVAGQSVHVTGGGFDAGASLGSAECKASPASTADCDLGTAELLTADDSGNYAFDYAVHSEINTPNGFVDCTASDGACVLAIADTLDLTNIASAPLSFATQGPPQPGVLHAPVAPVAADYGVDFSATGFAPLAVVQTTICAANPTDADDCDVPITTSADGSGAFDYGAYPQDSLLTQNNRTIDCTVDGACIYAAWDVRDFAATLTTAPVRIAPEVPGTLTVTPSTGLHDGDEVTLSGTGWPADFGLEIPECDGNSVDADCTIYALALTDSHGAFSTTTNVVSVSDEPYFDCETGPCYMVAAWYTDDGVETASQAITFDTTTTAVTSHYTAAELTAVSTAAATLGISNEEVQHLGSWGLAWVLLITGTHSLTPVPNTGPGDLTTNWLPSEYKGLNAFAASEGTTLAEFQKTGALFLAYVLSIS